MPNYDVVNPPLGVPYAPPNLAQFLQQSISSLPGQYFQGTQMGRQRMLQQPILDPQTGQPITDPGRLIPELLKRGGAEYAQQYVSGLLPYLYGWQAGQPLRDLYGGGGGGPPSGPNAGPASFGARPQQPQQPLLSSAGADNAGGTSLSSLAVETGVDLSPYSKRFEQAYGVRWGDPLPANRVADATQNIRAAANAVRAQGGGRQPVNAAAQGGTAAQPPFMGGGTNAAEGAPGVAASSQPGTSMPPSGIRPGGGPVPGVGGPFPGAGNAPAPPASAAGAIQSGLVPQSWIDRGGDGRFPGTVPGFRDAITYYSSNPALSPADKAMAIERVKAIDAYLAKEAETPQEVKTSRAAGYPGPVEFESAKGREGEYSKAVGKEIAGYVEKGGQPAQQRIQMLDTIGDALKRGGGNISTGPFAETALHFKQALSNLFSNFGWDDTSVPGLAESEVVQKTGFNLATLAVKEISSRPTQAEFIRALQNNPGLLLSPKGSQMMIEILKQSARQDIALAKLAGNRANRDNWPDVVDKFYQTHPLISPFTKKPVGMADLATISEGAPAQAGQPKAPLSFNSLGDVKTAYGQNKIKIGDVIKIPNGTITVDQQTLIDLGIKPGGR